ncbi:cupredoxin domain-containing protein [Anaerobacillus sp. CMMVII]|uniref:cupredoxin domain-containing protein n=1 Tax=Anaerobacillus sp. CMMVII TaxID=2755588 RepID=UPI0021B73B59|nr:cupredoxin domain-containing protein [Anaerobacillus sp. CMMVII]MCT8136924.1 cupredoxin domain-containing protein [Anaerobacillus sp. CMMVII]
MMKVEVMVMLLILSMMIIIALTVYVTYYTFKMRSRLTCMAGMMIAMTNAMMSSVALGTIFGVYYNSDLSTPTIIAVAYGMLIGYLTGKPISMMAALDGLGAGVMGGMMGAMLGVMLLPNKIDLTILFILFVFIVVMVVLLKVIDEEVSASSKNKEPERRPFFANPILLVMIVLFMAISTYGKNYVLSSGEKNEFMVPMTTYGGNDQQAVINVKVAAYEPNNIFLKAGEPSVLNFQADKLLGCSSYIYSNDLNFMASITPGSDNFIEVGSLDAGIYNYACTMNMFSGTVTVQ